MKCPFCQKLMTPLNGKQAAEKLLGALFSPTSALFNMAKGSMSNQPHVKGSHCTTLGCGFVALFTT